MQNWNFGPAQIVPNFNDFRTRVVSNDRLKIEFAFYMNLCVERETYKVETSQEGPDSKGQGSGAMWRNLTKAVRELQRSFGETGGTYRPDRHYMRGPGPKWHAKYGNLAPKHMPTARTAPAAIRDAAEHHA
jgi:hypothetical protein